MIKTKLVSTILCKILKYQEQVYKIVNQQYYSKEKVAYLVYILASVANKEIVLPVKKKDNNKKLILTSRQNRLFSILFLGINLHLSVIKLSICE